MLVLGVTEIEFKCWLRGGSFCYCHSGFVGIVVDVWALIVRLLFFSLQASNIKEYFECLDLSWRSMTSRTHLKEVHALYMINLKLFFYFKIVKFRLTWCVTSCSSLTDPLTFLSQAMTPWQMMRVIMTSTPWLVFSNFTSVVWKTLFSPKRDSTICWPVSVRTCISPPFTPITPLWCGCTSCQWSGLNLCSTKISQKILDSFWRFCLILEFLLHALGKISQSVLEKAGCCFGEQSNLFSVCFVLWLTQVSCL